jgi:hypothetical protein
VWRKNHIAVGIGNVMLIHGGIDENDRFLSDAWILEFNNYRWNKLEYKGQKPAPIAYHACELIIDVDRLHHPHFNVYRSPDATNTKNKIKRIKIEGVYLFGGMDENRNYSNELRILKVGKRPTEWVYPRVHGSPPCGRVNAQMNFYSELNILILHGGRNDREKKTVLNDIFVFDLENLIWIKAATSFTLSERTEHRSVIKNDKLIILGGISTTKFLPMDICQIHLDLFNKRKHPESSNKVIQVEYYQEKPKTKNQTGNNRETNKNLLGINRTVNIGPEAIHASTLNSNYMNRGPKKLTYLGDKKSDVNFNQEIIPFLQKNQLNDLIKYTANNNDSEL